MNGQQRRRYPRRARWDMRDVRGRADGMGVMRFAAFSTLLVTTAATLFTAASPLAAQAPALQFSTTFSGYGASSAQAIAYDSDGSIFVAGYTEAADYPVVAPGVASGGGVDAVVMKLAAGGTRIVWSTYLGGKAEDRALALAPDGLGGVYVAGFTTSSNFPLVSPKQNALKGSRDIFLTRFSATGTIAFSTYYGGSGAETAYALAADSTGVWVAGVTDSTDFPRQAAYQTACKGRQDGFFARFTLAGSLVSASYAGASGDDIIRSAAIGPGGVLVLGGGTDSPDWGFTAGALKSLGGDQDGFVLKFDAAGATRLGGTYLGGSGGLWTTQETVMGVAVTPDGLIWAGGASPSPDFPKYTSWQAAPTDLQNAYLVRFDAGLTQIQVSSLIGGTQRDGVTALAVDGDGTLFATGFTTSLDFPAIAPVQAVCGGSRDSFVLRWPKTAPSPDFASCLGGRGSDTAQAIAASSGKVAVAGISDSSNYPTVNPLQPLIGSTAKAFVSEYGNMKAPVSLLVLNAPSPASGQDGSQTFEFSASHASGGSAITQLTFAISPDTTYKNACAVRYLKSSGRLELADSAGNFSTSIRPGTTDIASNANCVLFGSGSSAVVSGTLLKVRAPVVLLPGFAGAKNLLVAGVAEAAIGPVKKGTWTVPSSNSAPTLVSASAPGASGTGGVFSVSASDAQGASDIGFGYLFFNKTYNSTNACFIILDHTWQVLYLGNDALTQWQAAGIGEQKILENSQCRLKAASTRIVAAGNLATYELDVVFKSNLAGQVTLWADVADKASARRGYFASAVYEVNSVAVAPALGTPSPSAGQGNVQTFAFSASHANGAEAITESAISISPGMTTAGACTVRYVAASKVFQLADTAGAYQWTVRPGTTDVASSTVCSLFGAASRASASGTTLEARAGLVMLPAFAGTRNILQSAAGPATAAWQNKGSWTVLAANSAPGVLRLEPSAPSGSSLTMDFLVADANGETDLTYSYGLFNSSFVSTNGCMFVTDRMWKVVYLQTDSGSSWSSGYLGENKVLENSQCRIHLASSTQTSLAGATRYRLDFSFKAPFAGAKRAWAYAVDAAGAASAWAEFTGFTAQ